MNQEQLARIRGGQGFIAALDQSGGSTPKALAAYGVSSDEYNGDEEMFATMHAMRSRIVTSPAFNGDRVLGAILFENTMDRNIEGKSSAAFLWEEKQVVPFLKVDKGLADEAQGVQLMNPMPGLDELCSRAVEHGVFGTKMRSVIKVADQAGIDSIVDQQFEVGRQILGHGLVPILEPEIDIHSPSKAEAEAMARASIAARLDELGPDDVVMLKLTLPEEAGFYSDLVAHPAVASVVALSGGYSRSEANDRLSKNAGVIASFSRALTEGLSAQQSDEDFNSTLDTTIESIYQASIAG